MNTIFSLVMKSDLLKRDVERFTYVNNLDPNGAESESYMLGYVRAIEDVYTFLESNNHLILKIYEKQ